MSRGIVKEPCTLVYSLLDNPELSFDDFYLIVRSMHTFMVDKIIPVPESSQVHVKLNYQASTANATAKLGDLQEFVSISKLSVFVKESELSHLEQLKRRFNMPSSADLPEPVAKPKARGFKQTTAFFAARPAPYKKAAQKRPITETEDSDNYAGHDPTDGF